MPPFLDCVHLHQAMTGQAVPVLEAIAANDNLRLLRRFERDEPPPCVSSTESEELDDIDLIPRPLGQPMPDELKAIMDAPLDDFELKTASYYLGPMALPNYQY